MQARKIALFLPNLEGGGAERVMLTVAAGLAERGLVVDLVVACAQGQYRGEVPRGVRLVDLGTAGVVASLLPLSRYLKRESPESLLVTLNYASVVALWARRLAGAGTHVVVREANTPSTMNLAKKNLKTRVLPHLMRFAYRWADEFIAVSKGVAEDSREFLGIPAEKITTIHNPVVNGDIVRLAQEEAGHEWFDRAGPPVILSVGRLAPGKDFPTLIRAFSRVLQSTDARLVILGEGDERPKLEALVGEHGLSDKVSLPGFVSNPFAYMSRARVYVLSSRREGLPGALIQAMACGAPVVATDCPSGPAEVLDGGRYGALVRVGDDEGMADAVVRTLREPPSAKLVADRAALYSVERSLEAYYEVIVAAR